MLVLILQNLVSAALLAFAVFALGVARRTRRGVGKDGWLVTGVVFAVYTVDKIAQGVLGALAFAAGPGAPVYDLYLRLAPMADHSRTFLVFAFYGSLAALPFRNRLGRAAVPLFAAAIVGSLVLGAAFGWWEGTFNEQRHYTTTALIDTGGFIILASVLFFLMLRDAIDRHLWFVVATYGFTSITGVLYLMAFSWLRIPGAFTPPLWHLQVLRLIFALVMVGLAARRLQMARNGLAVAGLLGDTPSRPSVFAR